MVFKGSRLAGAALETPLVGEMAEWLKALVC